MQLAGFCKKKMSNTLNLNANLEPEKILQIQDSFKTEKKKKKKGGWRGRGHAAIILEKKSFISRVGRSVCPCFQSAMQLSQHPLQHAWPQTVLLTDALLTWGRVGGADRCL